MNANEIINTVIENLEAKTMDGKTLGEYMIPLATNTQKMLDAMPELLEKHTAGNLAIQAESAVKMIARKAWGKNSLDYFATNSKGQMGITSITSDDIAALVAAHAYGDPKKDYSDLLKVAEKKGYKSGWAYYQLREKYNERVANIISR